MGLYQDIKGRNLIGLLREFVNSGQLAVRESDGKFVAKLRVEHNTPWIHVKPFHEINCFLWKDILFHGIVEKKLPASHRFVPIGCQNCFKVVVRPQTLDQLFELEALQKKMDLPAKCGVELRDTVFGNYGGYFYNRGLEAGLLCWSKIRKEVNECIHQGLDIPVILKRGCTEMEHSLGRSDEWKMTDEQIEFETRLNQYFVNNISAIRQTDELKDDVRQRWIERAYSIGDKTYLNYTDGESLHPEYVTYHHLLDAFLAEQFEAAPDDPGINQNKEN